MTEFQEFANPADRLDRFVRRISPLLQEVAPHGYEASTRSNYLPPGRSRRLTMKALDAICVPEQAIATLVLAFGTDPVARWIYPDALQYSLHTLRLFLGASSFEAKNSRTEPRRTERCALASPRFNPTNAALLAA
jgi:hypothetical protein